MAINIHIDTINVTPDVFTRVIEEQLGNGADPEVLGDIGYQNVPTEVDISPGQDEPVVPPTEEEKQEADEVLYSTIAERFGAAAIEATARRNFLRNVVAHADTARKLTGFQTNHQRRPDNLKRVSAKAHAEEVMASESLQNACAACALRASCRFSGDIDTWLDFHPYKESPRGERRPGSLLPPGVTESRADFLKALKKDPLAHCDPRKRPVAKK